MEKTSVFGLGSLNLQQVFVGKETGMLRVFKKKDEAVKNWRSRAMLIDLHETRITLVYS